MVLVYVGLQVFGLGKVESSLVLLVFMLDVTNVILLSARFALIRLFL